MSWQPIETAPKDGTRVLLFREGFAENMAICWYNHDWKDWVPVHGTVFPEATHWMPCPEAPEGSGIQSITDYILD